MKITGIRIKQYELPLEPPFSAAWDPIPRRLFATTLVFIDTDQGITGIGSGDLMHGFAGHESLFVGQSPFLMERHAQILDNIDFHYGRSWPLDLALWDLFGKAVGQPVSALLGAKRQSTRAYASTGEIVAAEERVERALRCIDEGFKAIKIRFHHQDVRDDIRVVEALRRAVGDKLDIMVDANQGWKMPWDTAPTWDLKQAVTVARELERLNVFWLEEPLPHHQFDELARLRSMTDLRIAGGEMNRRWHDFRQMERIGALDVYQPDVALCGGISRVKKVAELVQGGGAWFSPHTWSNGIGLLANLHLAVAVSDCPYLEFPYDPPTWTIDRRDFVQAKRLMVDPDGFLNVPDLPGLGIELDMEVLSRYEVRELQV